MSKSKKRAYSSQLREEKAALTQMRILNAAKSLFQKKGFEGVTIDEIARKALVSTPMIYALFQSKRGLLRALMDEALPSERRLSLVKEATESESPKKRMKATAQICREMYDAERAQFDLFRGSAVLSPEFKELEKEREERRHERQREAHFALFEKGALKKELSFPKSLDILWAFTGRDLYRMLVIERGWSPEEYESWLSELLIKTLLREKV